MKRFYRNLMILLIPMLVVSMALLNWNVTAQDTVKIGILFPKYLTQGGGNFGGCGNGGMYDGAQMAAKEINDTGGINVGGTMKFIDLDLQDEGAFDPGTQNYNTAITTASMTEMLTSGCQFIVGGFRTETTTQAIADLKLWNAAETPVPFFISGSATSSLINTTSAGGQWVFRVTPVNDTQLFYTVANYLKQYLAPKLAKMYTNATYPPATPGQFRYAVIAEDLSWTQNMALYLTAPPGFLGLPLPGYSYFLGPYVNTTGVPGSGGLGGPLPGRNMVPATGYDFTPLVSSLNSSNVHLIIDIFTMPEVNNLIAAVKAANMPAVVMGIDVPGQQQSHWSDTATDANYECLLCWSGTGTPTIAGYSDTFFGKFCNFTGGYWPMYTASGAYDAIYQIKNVIESAGTTNPNTLLPVFQGYQGVGLSGMFKYTTAPVSGNDEYSTSNGINWSRYGAENYGWARSQIVQWINASGTAPPPGYPNVGAQMNVISPLYLTDVTNATVKESLPYARKTMIPPAMYPLAYWDVNLDGKVDMRDIAAAAAAFGATPKFPKWNLEADINTDGKIDMKDIAGCAAHFGQSQTPYPMP